MPGPEVKSQDNKLTANLFIGFIGSSLKFWVTLLAKLTQLNGLLPAS
jgi:hypothetical protein